MAPTLKLGEHVTASLDPSYTPQIGDIVVFNPPAGYIKRIVAGPGDTIAITNSYVIRNGRPEKEPYVLQPPRDQPRNLPPGITLPPSPDLHFPTPITIPADHYFVLGDNRAESQDSRYWGPVPRAWIIGTIN